jgi:hypothetical protein
MDRLTDRQADSYISPLNFVTIIIYYNKGNIKQNTPVTKAFDRDVGIVDMHIGDMFRAISGKYLDILSPQVN